MRLNIDRWEVTHQLIINIRKKNFIIVPIITFFGVNHLILYVYQVSRCSSMRPQMLGNQKQDGDFMFSRVEMCLMVCSFFLFFNLGSSMLMWKRCWCYSFSLLLLFDSVGWLLIVEQYFVIFLCILPIYFSVLVQWTEPLYVHRQTSYLFGRERRVADIPTDHPSCSKQHAVLQYRLINEYVMYLF